MAGGGGGPANAFASTLTDLMTLFSGVLKENTAFFLSMTVRMIKKLSPGLASSPPSSATVTAIETLEATH